MYKPTELRRHAMLSLVQCEGGLAGYGVEEPNKRVNARVHTKKKRDERLHRTLPAVATSSGTTALMKTIMTMPSNRNDPAETNPR